MPSKIFELPTIGELHVYKRSGSTSIRLGFDSKGNIRVSIPKWAPYQSGIQFAVERTDWIEKHRPEKIGLFMDGDKIGKAHHLTLTADHSVSTAQVRQKGSEIIVKYPAHYQPEHSAVQSAAERGAKKALLQEGQRLLPQRLTILAQQLGFKFNSVDIKQLKTKWGSCNQNHEITLNYYLLQLPWKLIDYVLIHELVHTEHLNHSEDFWNRFEQALPGARKIRKELKTYKTAVIPS